MSGIKIPKGTISIHTFPVCEQGYSYRTCCDDYSVNIFIKPPEELRQHIQRAAESPHTRYDTQKNVYTPCVIDKIVHRQLSHHRAWLLSPPEIDTNSELFVPGLLIPDLRLQEVIERGSRLMGYILISDYAGGQQFFAPPKAGIDTTSSTKYQGVVEEIPQDKRRKPVARIELSSNGNDRVFQDNAGKLEDIASSSLKFWWKS